MYMNKIGAFADPIIQFEEQLDRQIEQSKEERPSILRSNVVDKHLIKVLDRSRHPEVFKRKLAVVKKILEYSMDSRVLNNMR